MSIIDSLRLWTTNTSKRLNRMLKGEMTETYNLNSSQKIDTAKARGIYHNTENSYKLASGMIKPIINADVAFIGEPLFKTDDDRTNEELKEIQKSATGLYQSTHMVALREGDMYIWVQWDATINNIRFVSLPEDKLRDIVRDPVTNEVIQYNFAWNVHYKDKALKNKTMQISIIIDKDVIIYNYSGAVPKGYQNEVVQNVLKEIPVVQFSNEREFFESKGHSEITPLEPYLKAYHDVMMMALQAQKNNAAPKLKIKVSSVQNFIDNNFGAGEFESYRNGDRNEGFSVENLDLVLLGAEDEADYMIASSTTGSAEPLLALLFYLIVETSETIEVVFGANLGTSLASVNSQLPVYIKKVERKQAQFENPWKEVMRLALKLKGFVDLDKYSSDIRVIWPEVDFESNKDKALTLQTKLNTYGKAIKDRLISFEEAHTETRQDVPSIEQEYETHLEQVAETARLIAKYDEDAMSQEIDFEEGLNVNQQ